MKKLFTAIVAIAAIAMVTSCEQDAPEINFSQTDTHTSDFSELVAAMNSQTTTIETKLQLINDAIDAHECNNNYNGGIYRLPGDTNALYMHPSVWASIKGDPALEAAILSTLSEPVINITQILPAGHADHPITYVRTSTNTTQLAWMPDNTSISGVNQDLIKVYKKLDPEVATYTLFRGASCGLFFYEVFITDARGTNVERHNGGGTATSITGVDIYFEDGGNIVTSVSATANLH